MYIVAIAWIYVILMMAITERSVIAGIMTFLMYGVVPLTIILYLTKPRRRGRNQTSVKKRLTDSTADFADPPNTGEGADKAAFQPVEEVRPEAKQGREQ